MFHVHQLAANTHGYSTSGPEPSQRPRQSLHNDLVALVVQRHEWAQSIQRWQECQKAYIAIYAHTKHVKVVSYCQKYHAAGGGTVPYPTACFLDGRNLFFNRCEKSVANLWRDEY